MQSVDHAIETLATALKLPGLALNAQDHVEIVVEDLVRIDLLKVSDTELELSTALPDLEGLITPARMQAMLNANCVGAATGAGRLALDPATGRPLYCQRLNVARLDAAGLEVAMMEYTRAALFWLGEGTDTLLDTRAPADGPDQPMEHSAPGADADIVLMRL